MFIEYRSATASYSVCVIAFSSKQNVVSRDMEACCALLEKLLNTEDLKSSFQDHKSDIQAGLSNRSLPMRILWLRKVHFI